jgi:hypothetical protein
LGPLAENPALGQQLESVTIKFIEVSFNNLPQTRIILVTAIWANPAEESVSPGQGNKKAPPAQVRLFFFIYILGVCSQPDLSGKVKSGYRPGRPSDF